MRILRAGGDAQENDPSQKFLTWYKSEMTKEFLTQQFVQLLGLCNMTITIELVVLDPAFTEHHPAIVPPRVPACPAHVPPGVCERMSLCRTWPQVHPF